MRTSNIQHPSSRETLKLNIDLTAARFAFSDLKFFGAWSFGSQPDGVSCFKTARGAIGGLPARRPFAGVMIVWRRIESQSGDHGERVTFARVDGDPFARTAAAIAAKLS